MSSLPRANETVNISPTSSLRNGFAVIAGGARLCARPEGWPRVHALCPSFETLAEPVIGRAFARPVGKLLRMRSVFFTRSFAGYDGDTQTPAMPGYRSSQFGLRASINRIFH